VPLRYDAEPIFNPLDEGVFRWELMSFELIFKFWVLR